MMHRFIIFYVFLSLIASQARAQVISDSLKEITVEGSRLEKFAIGSKIMKFDSLSLAHYRFQNIAALLSNQSAAYIKNYGPANIATISLRGSNTSQTAVLWNGFNLQSSFLAQTDFSLLPTMLFDDIQLQHGGIASLYGSGGIGGALLLDHKPVFNKSYSASFGSVFGSFGNRQFWVKSAYASSNFNTQLKILHREALNNFSFKDAKGNAQTQQNAALNQTNIISNNHWKLSKNQEASLVLWLQNSDRQIPSNAQNNTSQGAQLDQSLRISSQWKKNGEKLHFAFRTAWLHEQLDYLSPLVKSYTQANQIIPEGEMSWKISKKHLLNIGFNHTFQSISSTNYTFSPAIHRLSFFSNYRYQSANHKLLLSLSLRRGFSTQVVRAPFTPMLGIEYKINEYLKLSFNASGNYRLPSLNDLYWNTGSEIGNPNLKPEYAWAGDLGLYFNKKWSLSNPDSYCTLTSKINTFNTYLFNAIQWQINQQGNWSPANLPEVWSRGLETTTDISFKRKNFFAKLSLNTSYVVATNQKRQFDLDLSYQKILIYTPIYNHQLNLDIAYKRWKLNTNCSYTGYRYTTSDNTQALPPILLFNIQANHQLAISSKFSLDTFCSIQNLFNASYQLIQNYPMPGINIQAGLILNFLNMFNQNKVQ
jgi:iron complex outermembrane receptor protein